MMNDILETRIVVPTKLRDKLLSLAHDETAHIGVRGMRSVRRARNWQLNWAVFSKAIELEIEKT